MVFSKEQLKNYWQSHKEELNRKRRERRRLAKLGLATLKEVSQVEPLNEVEPLKVSHNKVEPTANLETANPVEVSHGNDSQRSKPENGKPVKSQPCPHCPQLSQKIKEYKVSGNR